MSLTTTVSLLPLAVPLSEPPDFPYQPKPPLNACRPSLLFLCPCTPASGTPWRCDPATPFPTASLSPAVALHPRTGPLLQRFERDQVRHQLFELLWRHYVLHADKPSAPPPLTNAWCDERAARSARHHQKSKKNYYATATEKLIRHRHMQHT